MNEEHLIPVVHSILFINHSVLFSYCIASVTQRHTSIQRASQLCIRDDKPTAHLHSEVPHHQHERLAALYFMTFGSPKSPSRLVSQRAQFRISFIFFLRFGLGWCHILFTFSIFDNASWHLEFWGKCDRSHRQMAFL